MLRFLTAMSAAFFGLYFLPLRLCCADDEVADRSRRAEQYAARGSFVEAKAEFEKVAKHDPSYGRVRICLQAIRDVTAKKISKEAAVHFFKGETHWSESEWEEAISEFSAAIAMAAQYPLPYVERGFVRVKKDLIEYVAYGLFESVEALAAAETKTQPRERAAYDDKGELDRAVADFSTAVKIDSTCASAYEGRGLVQLTRAIRKLQTDDAGCSDLKRACRLGECNVYREAKAMGVCE